MTFRTLADRADTRQANPAPYPKIDWVKVTFWICVVVFLTAFWWGVVEVIS